MVKTKQVTHSVLNHLIEYVKNLEKVGLLEEKEMVHLHDAVQVCDWVSHLFNPHHTHFYYFLFYEKLLIL